MGSGNSIKSSASRSSPRTRISRIHFEAAAIPLCPGRRKLAFQMVPTAANIPAGAANAFTSEQNVRRYLRTHRICYLPD